MAEEKDEAKICCKENEQKLSAFTSDSSNVFLSRVKNYYN